MKAPILILSLLFSNLCFANAIDNLTTEKDVLRFIKKVTGREDSFHRLSDYMKGLDFGYLKIDIDKNGLTDLLVQGRTIYAIVDKGGRNNYEQHFIRDYHSSCYIVSIDTSQDFPLIIVQRDSMHNHKTNRAISFAPDTLINRFGGFVEYNQHPAKFEFDYLNASTSRCFGTCPVFDLTIKKSGEATVNAKLYNSIEGVYTTYIDKQTLKDLFDLLNYINIDSLKSDYDIDITDLQSIDLMIGYNHSIKKIHDYGLVGTFGLKKLYDMLYKIKSNTRWE